MHDNDMRGKLVIMGRNVGLFALTTLAIITILGCDHGVITGTYKDPLGGTAFQLKGDGTFTMTNLLECHQVLAGTYSVSGHKLRFTVPGSSEDPISSALLSEMMGEIEEGDDAFTVQGLSYVKTANDADAPAPCWSTPAPASTTISDASPAAPAPTEESATTPVASAPPQLHLGPKPSGQGDALGVYAQDGTFVPGEYDNNGQFIPGVHQPNGTFIAGQFVGREFAPNAVASGSGFLPSSP